MSQELFVTTLFNDANLVSYWRMEGNSNDSKGSNNGTATSITYGTSYGKFGQGALSTTSSSITLPLLSSATTNISFGGWYKWNGTDTYAPLFCTGLSNGYSLTMGSMSGSAGHLLGLELNGITYNALSSAYTMTSGQWFHAVVTRNSTTWTLYINGSSYATGTTNPNTPTTSSRIGPGFPGNYDDVFFCSRALTATEISNLYNGTLPSRFSGAWFAFA